MMSYDPTIHATPERLNKLRAAIARRQPTLTVVLENVHDEHNVAAVLRSCDAVGVLRVHLVYSGKEVYPEFGRKTSGSAAKWVDHTRYSSIVDCYQRLRSQGMKIMTTALSENAVSLYNVDLTQPIALVFGNEHDGVSAEAVEKGDGNIVIPQVGMVQSLNISVACAVSLFEAYRQRQAKRMYDAAHMNESEREELLRDWSQR